MSDLGFKFLAAALSLDGAKALRKAVEREPALAEVLIPRTIIGWLNFTTEHEYEGEIPGIENSYVQFNKSENGFSGTISLEDGAYSFKDASIYHLAASIATAMGIQPGEVDPGLRDQVLVKLGKSIDTLTKAQVLVGELKDKSAFKTQRLTTHGAYHIERLNKAEKPYSVIHTRSNKPVQTDIATLRDAQPIADWHHQRYGGEFRKSLSKGTLDLASGYKLAHQHHDIGGGDFFTGVTAHDAQGNLVGQAGFDHVGNQLKLDIIHVQPEHRRKGLASAMVAHAEQQTGKKVASSTARTDMGEAFWRQGLGKVELPGRTHQPTPPVGPQGATPPAKQPAQAAKPEKKPKLPSLSLGKSEAASRCGLCGGTQFEGDRFKGCICFRDLQKSITTTVYGDGYVLTFKPGIDQDSVKALIKTFRSGHE